MPEFTALVTFLAYTLGSVVCHQMPDRSFFLAGRQFPVCARCCGLYAGVVLGLMAWWAWRRVRPGPQAVDARVARDAFLVVLLPTAISWTSGALGFWDGSNVIRAALALPLGVTAGAIVAAAAAKDLR